MNIETTALKAALLRFSTNVDATGAEYDRLSVLADRLGDQMRETVEANGGKLLDAGGFGMGQDKAASEAPVTLELDAADVHNLIACCERITWPFSRFTGDMKTAVQALRKTDLPAWADQAEAQAALDKLTPEQRKAWAAKVAQ